MEKYKIQNKKTGQTRYIVSSDYKIGDTVLLKWQKEWVVIKILPIKREV
jgi:hypothetical protein